MFYCTPPSARLLTSRISTSSRGAAGGIPQCVPSDSLKVRPSRLYPLPSCEIGWGARRRAHFLGLRHPSERRLEARSSFYGLLAQASFQTQARLLLSTIHMLIPASFAIPAPPLLMEGANQIRRHHRSIGPRVLSVGTPFRESLGGTPCFKSGLDAGKLPSVCSDGRPQLGQVLLQLGQELLMLGKVLLLLLQQGNDPLRRPVFGCYGLNCGSLSRESGGSRGLGI